MLDDPIPARTAVVSEVERRRLLQTLRDSDATVVVLSAPAGSGKSVLAQQWLARDPRVHRTLRIAAHMDDVSVLTTGIVETLESIGPSATDIHTSITAAEPVFSGVLLPALSDLAGTRRTPFVLVVDDVHLLQGPSTHRVVEAVCEGTPPGSSVVLITRGLTPEWLGRIRATGRLLELAAGDLNFDAGECAALLEGLGLRPESSETASILDHTEGWPVGVYLTALSMRSGGADRGDPARVTTGSDRIVADYLRTQVLAALDEDHRRFLVLTSVLDELHGPLCDAVLERTDSTAILAGLHQRIQLVLVTDADRQRFRCHNLLADQLLAELRTCPAEEVAELHRRASLWFDAHGDHEAAIRHATASGDMSLTSRMIWPEVAVCLSSGFIDRLRYWLSALTDRQVDHDPWLSLASAWAALQSGDRAALGRWIRVAERHAGPEWREAASGDPYAAKLAVLHALVGSGGLDDTRDLCQAALRGLAADDPFRAPAAFLRGVVLTLQWDEEAGRASLAEAVDLGRSLGVPATEADARSWLGMLAIADGDRELGMHELAEAADIIRRHHLDRLATGAHVMTAQALVLALMGDKAAATATLATARQLCDLLGDVVPWFAVTGRLIQARTAVHLGDGATARRLLVEARAHMTPDLQVSSAADSLLDTERVLAEMSRSGGPASALTATELRVLQFLPSHLTVPQIGEHLFVSSSTVKTHVLSIYRKLGVGSRAEAVVQARRLGLVDAAIAD